MFCYFFVDTPIMTVLVWIDKAINMVNMGVAVKKWQNVDSLQKRIGKKLHLLKSYGQNQIFCKFFLVTPKVYA